jgi:hypothetical protein
VTISADTKDPHRALIISSYQLFFTLFASRGMPRERLSHLTRRCVRLCRAGSQPLKALVPEAPFGRSRYRS